MELGEVIPDEESDHRALASSHAQATAADQERIVEENRADESAYPGGVKPK
jgi:hypothetical protein